MHVFYCPDITDSTAILSAEESAHCVRVLRLAKGEKVLVIDGKGGMYEASVTVSDARECRLGITKQVPANPSRKFKLHIAIAPTKNIDRFEWFLEKAVEIGVDAVTPLLCSRSERRILNTSRLYKLIISTMKQAMVPIMPELHELTPIKKFLDTYQGPAENRMIAHCEETSRIEIRSAIVSGKDTVILIGPEGDFTPQEIN